MKKSEITVGARYLHKNYPETVYLGVLVDGKKEFKVIASEESYPIEKVVIAKETDTWDYFYFQPVTIDSLCECLGNINVEELPTDTPPSPSHTSRECSQERSSST